MQFHFSARAGVGMAAALMAIFWQAAPAQQPIEKEPQTRKGIPPRSGPGDYQAHIEAGGLTLAGDFTEHSVATPDGTYETDDYVVVEIGLFGPPQARKTISYQDFSLRINGKKTLSAQPYEVVLASLKDPLWAPPKTESKSKTSIGGGGGGDESSTPAPVHMPFDLHRAMELRVEKAALPQGERVLPEDGLLFFEYHGKAKSIRSVELTYAGMPGNAVLRFEP
jgi:hypothetical protein